MARTIRQFRDIPIEHARILVRQYRSALEGLQRSLDEKAQAARAQGLDPESHLQRSLDFDLHGWSEAHYGQVLQQLGLHLLARREEPWGPTLNLMLTT